MVSRAGELCWEVLGRVSRLTFVAVCSAHGEDRLSDFEVRGGLLLENRYESRWTHVSAVRVNPDTTVFTVNAGEAADAELPMEWRKSPIASFRVVGRKWYAFKRDHEHKFKVKLGEVLERLWAWASNLIRTNRKLILKNWRDVMEWLSQEAL